ncbi:MAG: threonine synthase [Acidobacteria bacterium]|nr:threonine synthase [Acidobacteriota bacterium]
MRYISTRGQAPALGFGEVLLEGLATDGGLYLPERWPSLPSPLPHGEYHEVATEVMWPFVESEMPRDEFAALVKDAYCHFDDPAVAPLRRLDDKTWLCELFHGPTFAFKDIALQLVGRLFDRQLAGTGRRAVIVGATSGDTGSAAIEACRQCDALDIVMLHPAGRVSETQRRQMTTVDSPNVHNIAIDGTFDDCQRLVKDLFADESLRREVGLAAVNSINWARIMAQIVYYVTASSAFEDPTTFVVPTGNFGNVFAGHAARRMGAPIKNLIVASNENDILPRFFSSGSMESTAVIATHSPSMDIQVSSNFERLMFESVGRDASLVADLMATFAETGTFSVPDDVHRQFGDGWAAERVDDEETLGTIAAVEAEHGIVIDPHTAVAVAASRRRSGPGPYVVLATAHPAKFSDAVKSAIGVAPQMPPTLARLAEMDEHVRNAPADVDVIATFVRDIADRAAGRSVDADYRERS